MSSYGTPNTVWLDVIAGTPIELWTGTDNETEAERAARLDAADEIFMDLKREDPESSRFVLELMFRSQGAKVTTEPEPAPFVGTVDEAPLSLAKVHTLIGGVSRSGKSAVAFGGPLSGPLAWSDVSVAS
ncbi:hypothetical protein [Streptomyces sp. NPDC127197]|uniref:hypothetical protein n=1 Tax=Streptomyces sp. NPDC127197 TaxID=3345388 RepID=UPI0036401DA9